MLYVPLDFENGLTLDALVDSGDYVSAIAQSEMDKIKQQAPAKFSESTPTQVAKSIRKWLVRETDSNSHTYI